MQSLLLSVDEKFTVKIKYYYYFRHNLMERERKRK